ncbi:hypothetical protein SASPL_142981 [Salvia splendens]|uniref:Uncharacterized protein n=1 Tax=Salvia splendens TaxID=180675 RepID=A0A8X8ZAD6_SALSN|nr:hypothetical protein SASPL_142981 [Salvia splendens]
MDRRPHLGPSTEDQATCFGRAIGEEGYKLVKEGSTRIQSRASHSRALSPLLLRRLLPSIRRRRVIDHHDPLGRIRVYRGEREPGEPVIKHGDELLPVGVTLVNGGVSLVIGRASHSGSDIFVLLWACTAAARFVSEMANSAFGDAYFQESHDNGIEALKGYKSVLECKGKEDSLLPRLGRADAIGALDEDPRLMHRYQLRVRLSRKGGRGRASDDEVVLVQREDAKAAAETLKGILKTGFWHHDEFLGTLPAVAVASLLIDTVACVVKIIDSVEVLSTEAKFEKPDPAFFTLASTNSDSEISKLDFFII